MNTVLLHQSRGVLVAILGAILVGSITVGNACAQGSLGGLIDQNLIPPSEPDNLPCATPEDNANLKTLLDAWKTASQTYGAARAAENDAVAKYEDAISKFARAYNATQSSSDRMEIARDRLTAARARGASEASIGISLDSFNRTLKDYLDLKRESDRREKELDTARAKASDARNNRDAAWTFLSNAKTAYENASAGIRTKKCGPKPPPNNEVDPSLRTEISGVPTGPGTVLPCSVGGGQDCNGPSFVGPFGGVQVVGSWSGVRTNEYFAAPPGIRTNAFRDSGQGFGVGINWGYNWQPWGNNVVAGIVFDANLLNDEVRRKFAGGTFIRSTVNFTASAQVRAGVLATPNLLLYGQTGLSVANQQLKINFGGPVTNESQFTPGFSLGGGAEWQLPRPLFPGLGPTSLFIDYRHTWWNTAMLKMPAASPLFNYDWRRQSDALMLGMRVRFGTQ